MLTVDPFPYQDEAIDRALDRGNLLIAYGMGLGKTLVTMAICETLLGDGEIDLAAIVVPASLKWQWAQALVWGTDVEPREIRLKGQKIVVPERRHAVVIDGSPEKRRKDYRFIRDYRPNYVIMGYENVVNDPREVNWIKPDLIAGDEITAIKSFQAARSQKFKEWWAPWRFGLTGTPIDNRADELFSIMEWIDPDALGSARTFDLAFVSRDGYGRVKRYKNLNVLHEKTKDFVVRKTRFDPEVAPFMPKDFHKEIEIDLYGKTAKFYREVANDLIEALQEIVGGSGWDMSAYYSGESSNGSAEQGNAMARYGALAMLCDHPWLLRESAMKYKRWMEEVAESGSNKPPTGSKYAFGLLEEGRLDWITDKVTSPKFEEAVAEIHDLLDEREENKIIVFSFAKAMLRYFQDRLPEGCSVIFDGDMTINEKEAAKQRFKTDPKVRVFLSSDAGGMGVDLPEANYLINYNHPWSAGKADQRNSRHIRAGSQHDEVWVLNYIVKGSVEEWKFSVLDLKRRVGSAIIDGGPTDNGVITFDVSSLLEWLSSSRVG